MYMRSVILACVLAACGGTPPPAFSSPPRTLAPTTRAPRRITRPEGRGLAASVALTGTQFDWWIELAITKANNPTALPPPPPPPSGN